MANVHRKDNIDRDQNDQDIGGRHGGQKDTPKPDEQRRQSSPTGQVSGNGRTGRSTTQTANVVQQVRPATYVFADDGLVPNNILPLLVYRAAIVVGSDHSERTIEGVFGAHGWGAMWRNGVYDYLHYHATVHEALAVARGHARVRFGGDGGDIIELAAGDAVVLPAGTGHQCLWASDDFVVVGAYPPGPPMQITRPTPENRRPALKTIPDVALPATDPLFGVDGPLVRIWTRAGQAGA